MFPSRAWLLRAGAALAAAGVEAPAREARLLLSHATGRSPAAILGQPDAPVPGAADAALARRCRREPLAFITGRQGFWNLDLEVSPATLIPRADSETLIAAALAARPDRRQVSRILDLGTGTGCLLLALLTEFPGAYGVGIDRSTAAIALAGRNAAMAGLAHRAGFVAADWGAALGAAFDVVVANPPYVESAVVRRLMPEVAAYEPAGALDGGADGLDAYRALLPDLPRLLAPEGVAILEVGAGQVTTLCTLARAAGLASEGTRADLGGIARALILRPSPA